MASSYWPGHSPPQRRWYSLVSHLRECGGTVSVVCPVAHYGAGPDYSAQTRGRAWRRQAGFLGEHIYRVPYVFLGDHRAGKLLDQMVSAAAAMARGLVTGRQNVVVVTAPSLPLLASALIVARVKGIPLVVEMRDAWPNLAGDASLTLGECLNLAVKQATEDVLSKMDDHDFYAPRYLALADLLDALRYANADVVGKQGHSMYVESQDAPWCASRTASAATRISIMGPTITGYREVFCQIPFQRRSPGEDTFFLAAVREAGYVVYSADRFNFVQFRGSDSHTWQVSDAAALASGRVVMSGDSARYVTV